MKARCILAVLLIISSFPIIADPSDAGFISVRIAAVYPTEAFEGFALENYGSDMDLKGYSVTDGEGNVNFTSSLTIHRGERIYFCKTAPPGWFDCSRIVIYGNSGVTMKGFALADNGDDIYLFKGETLIDSRSVHPENA